MQGPDGSLLRARSVALVGAVAALLTSIGTMTAHAGIHAPAGVHSGTGSVVVSDLGVPQPGDDGAVPGP